MVQPAVAFTFTAAGTSDELEGVLHSPAAPGPLTPALIVCHGLNNNMHLPLLVDLCQRRGRGRDVCSALQLPLRDAPSVARSRCIAGVGGYGRGTDGCPTRLKPSPGRTYLAGKSLGAVIAGRVAVAHPGLGGYVALGYPLHQPGGVASALPAYLARLGCPALFVIGDRDPYCRLEALQPVLQTIPTSCALATVAGGDHSFRPPQAQGEEYLAQAIEDTLAWIALQRGD